MLIADVLNVVALIVLPAFIVEISLVIASAVTLVFTLGPNEGEVRTPSLGMRALKSLCKWIAGALGYIVHSSLVLGKSLGQAFTGIPGREDRRSLPRPASGDIRENFHWLVGGDGIRSRPAFSATVSETDLNEVDAAAKAAVKGKQSTQVAFEEKEKRAQAQAAETDPCTVEEPAAVPPATPTPAPAADANRPPPPSLSRMRNEVSSAAATLCKEDVEDLDDDELLERLRGGMIPQHKLENLVGDCPRAVSLRREFFFDAMQSHTPGADVERARALPHENFDYESVLGACCENVIGYMPIPVGLVGPLKINGASRYIPMATTEGCLVASTNRGCKAITKSGGATCRVVDNGMTRAPVVCFPSALRACELKAWFENDANFARVRAEFESSSRFARLRRVLVTIAGRNVFIRFKSQTGDAMGMNMITKGVSKALALLRMEFPDMEVLSVSGNFCTDKKPSAVNWIEGRGKSVVCEAVIPATIVRSVLKTSVERMIDLNISKNLIGSAMAGSIGGFNAHASNILTAVYIATGQDPAQNVESSNCMTLLEPVENAEGTLDLHASVTMPSIEVGTVGGGTQLPAQAACLSILGVRGAHREEPGANAKLLAMYVAGSVLAGELSLMAALSAGDLMKAHLRYNRSAKNLAELAREAEAAAAAAPSSAASAAGTAAHTTCTAPP